MVGNFAIAAFWLQAQSSISPIVLIVIGLVVLLVIVGLVARAMRSNQNAEDVARTTHVEQEVPPTPSTANMPPMSAGPDVIPQTGGGVAPAPPVTETYQEEERNFDDTVITPPPYIPPAPETMPPAPPEIVQHAAGDDFTVINGISMRITEALNNAGIVSYDDLANSDPESLRVILQNAGFRLTDPTRWPEEARLAARGDMEALREYQRRMNDTGTV